LTVCLSVINKIVFGIKDSLLAGFRSSINTAGCNKEKY